jgi:hypothetical protein
VSGPYDRSESIPLPPKLLHLLVVISRFVRVSGAIDETRRLLRVLLNPEPENRRPCWTTFGDSPGGPPGPRGGRHTQWQPRLCTRWQSATHH